MNTQIMKVNQFNPEDDLISSAAEVLKVGGTVVFPTETVYGLGANALDENAVKKIFEAKGRPSDNPLIVHVSNLNEVYPLVEEIPPILQTIIDNFWPGPLTLILKKSRYVPFITTGGLDTVAIRMPNNKIALKLISKTGLPIAAPSANISGRPSPSCAQHVIDDLKGRVDIILDGGSADIGLESTVLDVTRKIPVVLRPGGITVEGLENILGNVQIDKSLLQSTDIHKPLSPGMKYKHYSPKANVTIFKGDLNLVVQKINLVTDECSIQGKKVGIIATQQTKDYYKNGQVLSVGDRNNLNQIASNLFTILREFDNIGVDIILSESFENEGIGLAIMNRLMKASGYNIVNI